MKRVILSASFEYRTYTIHDDGNGYKVFKNGKEVIHKVVTDREAIKEIDKLLAERENAEVEDGRTNTNTRSSKPTKILKSCQYGRIKSKKVNPPTNRCFILYSNLYNKYKGANSQLVNYKDDKMIVYFDKGAAESAANYSNAGYVLRLFILP